MLNKSQFLVGCSYLSFRGRFLDAEDHVRVDIIAGSGVFQLDM